MRALAGLLLAFALAAGVVGRVDARECANKHASKQISKSGVKKHNGLAMHSSRKSKLEKCVCHLGKSKTKGIASTGALKAKTYGGYKRASSIMIEPDINSSDFDSTKIVPLDNGDIERAQ